MLVVDENFRVNRAVVLKVVQQHREMNTGEVSHSLKETLKVDFKKCAT